MEYLKNNVAGLVAILLIAIYGVWSIWFKPVPTPDKGFIQPKPAVDSPKKNGPVIKPPVKVVDKGDVKDKFPEAQIKDDEEWVDTADIPPAPNGATVLVKIDTQSGEVTSQVENKKAPWFAFENNNYIGGGIEQHFDGEQKFKGYYKRDILRIKDIHLQGGATGKVNRALDKGEGFAEINLEYRF
jgi:hypothetical protein